MKTIDFSKIEKGHGVFVKENEECFKEGWYNVTNIDISGHYQSIQIFCPAYTINDNDYWWQDKKNILAHADENGKILQDIRDEIENPSIEEIRFFHENGGCEVLPQEYTLNDEWKKVAGHDSTSIRLVDSIEYVYCDISKARPLKREVKQEIHVKEYEKIASRWVDPAKDPDAGKELTSVDRPKFHYPSECCFANSDQPNYQRIISHFAGKPQYKKVFLESCKTCGHIRDRLATNRAIMERNKEALLILSKRPELHHSAHLALAETKDKDVLENLSHVKGLCAEARFIVETELDKTVN